MVSCGFSPKFIQRLLILIFIMTMTAHAKPAVSGNATRQYQTEVHDVNQVEMVVSNFGKFGQQNNFLPGCWWPRGSGHDYIYGAGSWFGTIIDGDTLVTVGYNTHGGQSEYVPGLSGMPYWDPDAAIFMLPSAWPPPIAIYPMAPQQALSHQDSWCAYNDLDASAHIPGDTRPIGLEVYQSVYAWNISTTEDMIFIRYEVKNVSGYDLHDCYFGVCTDNDIGFYLGELISGIVGRWYVVDGESLWVDNLGYQWQEMEEAGWSEFPGVIAFDYLQSPWDLQEGHDKDNDGILDQYERDSAYYVENLPDSLWDVDGDLTPDWRDPSEIPQLGMTAFKQFTLYVEPTRDNERYRTLAGFNFRTGMYEPFDTMIPPPDDQRFLQCSGPFELPTDSTAIVLVGLMFAQWYGVYASPDTALVQIDNKCQLIFDMSWILPGPPMPPNLICVSGDARITLIWDNVSEMTPDPAYEVVSKPGSPLYEPFYKQYDFEGYRIWKKTIGGVEEWQLLDCYDLANNIVFEDTTEPDSIRIKATDCGLSHAFVDNAVRNGFEYTYAVTAFDYNYAKHDTIDSLGNPIQVRKPIWYENSKFVQSVVPRRDPANLIAGRCSIEVISGNPLLSEDFEIDIVYPLAMTESSIFAEFTPIQYDSASTNAIYTSYLKNGSDLPVDSIHIIAGNNDIDVSHAFAPLHGIMVALDFIKDSIPGDESIFEQIEIQTGSYPESLVTSSLPGPWSSYFAYWAYRGNDYEVRWVSTTGSNTANSVVVTDMMTDDSIYYSPYNPESNHDHDSLANGWCFLSHLDVSDTLILYGSPPATRNTKFLYINGGLVGLKRGGFLQPGDVLPQTGDMWYVHANTDFHPAPANALFEIHSTPAYFDTVTKRTLNVKVVPNPFLVHNEWHKSLELPRLRFINLPADCTIRIFTLCGEFIRMIKHHHTNEPEPGETGVLNDAGGDEWWDLRSRTNHEVASGMYIYHIHSVVGEQVGKFVIIR